MDNETRSGNTLTEGIATFSKVSFCELKDESLYLSGCIVARMHKKQTAIITDNQEIASEFNKYFTSIGPTLSNAIPQTNYTHRSYLNKIIHSKFSFSPIVPCRRGLHWLWYNWC